MNPEDFLDVANELASGNREADWRSAVSRAYYAVYHVARSLLGQSGFLVPEGEQGHAYLWLRLANAGHPDVQQAGLDLNRLRRLRNRADYNLRQPFEHELALDSVQLALDLVRLLNLVATTPAVLTRITTAIRDYERDVLKEVTWRDDHE